MKKRLAMFLGIATVAAIAIVLGKVIGQETNIFGANNDLDTPDGYWDLDEREAILSRIVSSEDYDYLPNDDGTATIMKYTGDADRLTIPSEIDEYRVTGIGTEAFGNQKLKSVSIPDSIRIIDELAFYECEITESLQIPENITIGHYAFNCASLPSAVVIPAGTTVEKYAFSYCKAMARVCIDPGSVLKDHAFVYCNDLTLVVCGDGCRLETEAFHSCQSIETIFLCGDVRAEAKMFDECGDIEVTAGENYETLKQSALDGSWSGRGNASPKDKPEKAETEQSPAKELKTGDYLYQAFGNEKLADIKEEPPVKLTFHVDQEGNGKTATLTEGDALDHAVELFCAIQVGEVVDVFYTDSYNGIGFTWEDGSGTYIILTQDYLEYSVHSYELEHLDEFWSFCADYLEADNYE